jgi:hypothetical protein
MLSRTRPVAQALEHKADKRDRRERHVHSKGDMQSDVVDRLQHQSSFCVSTLGV